MATSNRRSSGTTSTVQADRPAIKWALDPNVLAKAVQSVLYDAKGPMSVEDLVGAVEKQHRLQIPGDGLPSKRMILNSVLRLVDQEEGGIQLRRRFGVMLPEHTESDFQLRETLREKGLSEADIEEVISGVRQTRKNAKAA